MTSTFESAKFEVVLPRISEISNRVISQSQIALPGFPVPVISRIIQKDVSSSSIEPPESFTAPVLHPVPAFDSLLLVRQSETKASDPIWVALGGVNHL